MTYLLRTLRRLASKPQRATFTDEDCHEIRLAIFAGLMFPVDGELQ